MDGLRASEDAWALLAPGAAVLAAAVGALGGASGVSVTLGAVDGFSRLEGSVLTLSSALAGPAMQHPLDAAAGPHGVDRWRRALGLVVEALAARALLVHEGAPDWLVAGLALDAADQALSGLRVADQALHLAATVGDFARSPRSGVAAVRALGRARSLALLTAGVSARDWYDAATGFLGAEGLAARLGLHVTLPEVDAPASLAPWSWRRVLVPAHPRGGLVRARGGACGPCWAVAGTPLRAIAVSLRDGGALHPEPGGPLGAWDLSSAAGFGSFFGARGMTWVLHASGRVDFLLADAFVGSVHDLPAAERVGTSGVAQGRWYVAGPRQIAFAEIRATGLTMHARSVGSSAEEGELPFAMPASGVGLGAALQVLTESPWRWQEREGRLHLHGEVSGSPMELRLATSASG